MIDSAIEPGKRLSALGVYYFTRAGVSAVWVALAFTLGVANPAIGVVLLVVYPAWDALANILDARASGGLGTNLSQTANAVISIFAAIAMGISATSGLQAMIAIFGLWAVLAGLFQLITGVRRWRAYDAQWAMVLSGAQSALAGGFFFHLSTTQAELSISSVGGYAGFGAFYFLVSALWLRFRTSARKA